MKPNSYLMPLAIACFCAHSSGATTVTSTTTTGANVWTEQTKRGESAEAAGSWPLATIYYAEAVRTAQKFGGDENVIRLLSIKLASSYVQQDNLTAAEPIFAKLMGTTNAGFDGESLVWLDDLADAYASVRREDLKESGLKRALAIKEKLARPGDGEVIRILKSLVSFYHLRKHYAEAEPVLEREIALLEKHSRTELPGALIELAAVEKNLKHYRRSLNLYNKIFLMWQVAAVNQGEQTASAAREIALLHLKVNEEQAAENWIEKAIVIRRAGDQEKSIEYCRDLYVYGVVLEANENFGKAHAAYGTALSRTLTLLGNNSTELVPIMEGMSRVLAKQGNTLSSKKYRDIATALSHNVTTASARVFAQDAL